MRMLKTQTKPRKTKAQRAKESRLGSVSKTASKLHPTYFELVQHFPLESIASDQHLESAVGLIRELLQSKLDAGGEAYLDALSDLVAVYEDDHFPMDCPSDAGMLAFLMDANGVNQSALAEATGIPKSSISEVLSGKKGFTPVMIRKLATYFRIDGSVLAGNIGNTRIPPVGKNGPKKKRRPSSVN